jgi:hypothetical protein
MARRSKDNAIDWDGIERQYRLGAKSNTQLATEFKVSESQIGRRAKQYGWVQDKASEVKATANALLIQNASGNANPNATPSALEVKVAAQVAADKVLEHRVHLQRLKGVFLSLLAELEVAATPEGISLIETLHEIVSAPGGEAEDDPHGAARAQRAREALMKALSLGNRATAAKTLTEVLEKIIKLERQAFGLDDGEKSSTEIEAMLDRVGLLASQ